MIVPTIGRKVWFYTAPGTPEQDATVIDVHGDSCVSLFVISRQGSTTVERSVILVQEGEETPTGLHCTWMPYQVQTAKAAQAPAPAPAPAFQPDANVSSSETPQPTGDGSAASVGTEGAATAAAGSEAQPT